MKTTGTNPDIEIIYEDNHLLAVSKPRGLLSQEDYSGKPDLLNLCKEYLIREYNKPGDAFLGLLHRLDKPVSGVMLFAKTSKAAARISEQIRQRTVKKIYLAIVEGSAPKNGMLTHYLKKQKNTNFTEVVSPQTKGAKRAELMYDRLEKNGDFSLLRITLITGRPHQIRVQLAKEGLPIFGDRKYGSGKNKHIALHAGALIVKHPVLKKEVILTSKPPSVFPWTLFDYSKIR